ncbi:MAG: peptide chain release factor N(5)-glutamine methyltransferase [Bacteroides sp.]
MITRLALLHRLKDELHALGLQAEVESTYRLIAEHIYAAPYPVLYADAHNEATPEQIEQQTHILAALATGAPLQYILGQAYFFNRPFRVTTDTLIPRPETEELCDLVLKHLPKQRPLRGLDLCTGSGCIAITLALETAQCEMEALELSHAALHVAQENARQLDAKIAFIEADLYTWEGGENSYDFIVSNPPYIPQSEALSLTRRVHDFEPHLALFVPTEAPTRPYRRIAYLATRLLKPGGFVACEIYETLGAETAAEFTQAGMEGVRLYRDFAGKKRIVFATKG